MEWQHPQALYLIVPMCVAWVFLALYAERRRYQARAAFAATAMWSRILPQPSQTRFWTKLILREIAIIAGLVALAGPRWGLQYEQVIPRGSDLYVLIDVSRSMLADDVPPSRLGRAKADVSSLVNRLNGERIGLIAFAGQAVVKCPLTVDYDSFRRALEELDPDSAPRGGTAIGDAIRKAIEVFHAKSDRDQAILLITDGDDQQSYPLEAAAVAAERHVTVFAVGLGDAERGARIPQKSNDKTYVEYEGEQVWSKLDGNLLQQIALKTNGVYVPAGTKAYDLGDLYTNHLQGRRSNDAATQQKIRRSERFQVFLGIALFALLIDLCIGKYRTLSKQQVKSVDPDSRSKPAQSRRSRTATVTVTVTGLIIFLFSNLTTIALALEPQAEVREGLKLYSKSQFDEAREKFGAAAEELEKQKSAAAAIAVFDEACASHRKGDVEKARDKYLTAGLSADVSIATSAHFNLGNMSAEKARTLAGEKPETVPPDKRKEILDQLEQAITAYRHCLELKPDHAPSRRNLELLRQWIKYYGEQWREQDRQKRRNETNLIQFLDFLIGGETSLRELVKQISENATADAFAELKRAQEELTEEIPTLREKIAKELRSPEDPNSPAASQDDQKQIEEGITMLQGWADTAGQKMAAAARQLGARNGDKAVVEQKTAIDELNKIWEAVIPFHPLLSKELADQTTIAKALSPESETEPPETTESPNHKEEAEIDLGKVDEHKDDQEQNPTQQDSKRDKPKVELRDTDLAQWEEVQLKALNRALLLGPKAEDELKRLENSPPPQATTNPNSAEQDDEQKPNQVDPEHMKAGYQKAVELAPQAVAEMEAALKAIHQKDRPVAGRRAEEARRILEEIQKAQPKNEQNQDQQQNQDQNQNGQNNNDPQQSDQNKDDQKSDEEQKSQAEQQEQQKQNQRQQASQDRIEEALRKVREREKEKHERDRKKRGLFFGKAPVDKDW